MLNRGGEGQHDSGEDWVFLSLVVSGGQDHVFHGVVTP